MKNAVKAKKDQLFKIKHGSVISSEPKFVWVKMLQRMESTDKILAVRRKFNDTLERLLAERTNHYIINVNPILRGKEYFTLNNELNGDGELLY